MINVAETTRIMPELNLRLRNPTMLDCASDQENFMRNLGRTDEIKLMDNVIIWGWVPTDVSKTCMLTEAIKRHQIDAVLLNEKNTKWSTTNAGRIEKTLKKITREAKMTTADSEEWNLTPKDHLPGGLMSAFLESADH